jgi:hypothetical protein
MSSSGSAPGERRGGRKPGTLNKATKDIREIAQEYAGDAIATLVAVMNGKALAPAARVQAARELLAYGYGKPGPVVQPDADGGGVHVTIYGGLPE